LCTLYAQNLICADHRLDLNKAPSNETVTLSEWHQGKKVLCLAYKDPRYPKYVDQQFAQKRKELEDAGITTIEGEPMYAQLHKDYLKAKNTANHNIYCTSKMSNNLKEQLINDFPLGLKEDIHYHATKASDKAQTNFYLLHGYTGTGKTASAELCAILTQRPLLSVCGALIGTAWKNSEIEDIFSIFNPILSTQDPWVIVLNFIECLEKSSEHELIAQLHKNKNKNAIIIGTTDDLTAISPALQRCFAKGTYEMPLPDFNSRKNIIELYLKEHELNYPADLPQYIAKRTEGFAGQRIKHLIEIIIQNLEINNMKQHSPFKKPQNITYNDTLKGIRQLKNLVRKFKIKSPLAQYHLQEFLDSAYFYPTVACTTIGALTIGAMLLLKAKESE
jgi:hypothetical protein